MYEAALIAIRRNDAIALTAQAQRTIGPFVEEADEARLVVTCLNVFDEETSLTVTLDDVAEYYANQARNLTSGCRTLAGLTGDWRYIDQLASMALAWFKAVNVKGVRAAALNHGTLPLPAPFQQVQCFAACPRFCSRNSVHHCRCRHRQKPCHQVGSQKHKSFLFPRDRLHSITRDFAEFLHEVPAERRTGPVFPIPVRGELKVLTTEWVSKVISSIGKAVGVIVDKDKGKFASAHDLRRAVGAKWAKRVMPAVLMRHSSIETSMRYCAELAAQNVANVVWKTGESLVESRLSENRPEMADAR